MSPDTMHPDTLFELLWGLGMCFAFVMACRS